MSDGMALAVCICISLAPIGVSFYLGLIYAELRKLREALEKDQERVEIRTFPAKRAK